MRSTWPTGLAAAFAAVLAAPPAAADNADPPRFGPAPYEDVRATGREVVPVRGRPEGLPSTACSFREATCVHAPTSAPPGGVMRALRGAEHALAAYRALGFPPPRGPYDLYLDPTAERAQTFAELVPSSDGWDRAPAFTVMPVPSASDGCAVGFEVARGVAQAVALGLDAGVEPGALAMTSSYLASLVAGCPSLEAGAIDEVQAHPERSFIAGDPSLPDGAMLFPWFLDDTMGVGGPGRAMLGVLALGTQRTPPDAWEWKNEPDTFDILRASMRDRGSTLDDLLLDFAVARAFVGSRSDGRHMTDVARFGDEGRVRFEWSVPFASLPRRLAPLEPVEPTGMTYLWLDLSAGAPGAELTFVADWELPALFRWSLVKVDKDGVEVGRMNVAGVYGDSRAQKTLVGLDGLAGIMVVGVNVGSIDRSHPFDPDEQPLMPHGYTVTFFKQ